MRRLSVITLALILGACSSSTSPSNQRDPSLLFNNQLSSPVYLEWRDGQGILGRDTIPAHTSAHCSHFLAQPDSAYFQITATDLDVGGTGIPQTSTITAPWFNPESRPAWAVDITPNTNGSPSILIREVSTECQI